MATVLLPRSLLALFPGVERRHDVHGDSVAAVIEALDLTVPGIRDRLVESGPRLRPHINVFVDGSPAELASPVSADATIHVIPAVSGGEASPEAAPAGSAPRGRRGLPGSPGPRGHAQAGAGTPGPREQSALLRPASVRRYCCQHCFGASDSIGDAIEIAGAMIGVVAELVQP